MKYIITLLMALSLLSPAHAAPKAKLWAFWDHADAASSQTIDHAPWGVFLKRYLVKSDDGIHRLRYGAVSKADKASLDGYVAALEGTAIRSYAKAEQRAYWMNLYNALTVKTILDHYPVKSIRDIDITSGLFADGPWGKKQLNIEGQQVSLDDIEHKILRPIWKDPRTHYAVNCASIGCPNLASKPFTPANMEALLNASARAYVNHPRGLKVSDGKVAASSIYDWFKSDFGGNDAGVIAHAKRYANPALKTQLEGVTHIDSFDYDWSLNDAK